MAENTKIKERLSIVGGQAVIEGVMMKHKSSCGLAVRMENGEIKPEEYSYTSIKERIKWLGWPIIRGVVNFVESMILSFKTLTKSAEAFGLEEEEPGKFEKWLERTFGKSIMDVIMVVATILALVLAVGLFMLLPTFLTKLLNNAVGDLGWWRNLIEGLIKIAIFLGYMWAVSFMKDIRRTFEYHGAEHKSIACFEAGELLTPENVKKHSRFHPRCGTSFIFIVLIVSILVYSLPFITWEIVWLRVLTKLIFLPVIVGICYEFLMYAGKHDNLFVRICSAPGLWVQRITTKEPDLEQIAVAIAAMKLALPDEYADCFPKEDTPANTSAASAQPEQQEEAAKAFSVQAVPAN